MSQTVTFVHRGKVHEIELEPAKSVKPVKPVIKRKWDFGFEADAAQQKGESVEAIMTVHASLVNPRQRRATPRFSDVVRAGMEAADNQGRPTLEDLRRENTENDRRRDDRHGRQP